jgi:hypothetical protein
MSKANKGQENLIPTNKRSKAEVREIGRKGGVASGKARREKKLLSEFYGSLLADTFDVKIEGEIEKLSGEKFFQAIVKDIVTKRDSSSVAMLKEIREATEGSKAKHELSGGEEPIKVKWQK